MKSIDRIMALLTVAMLSMTMGCTNDNGGNLPRGKAKPAMEAAADAFYDATLQAAQAPDHIDLHSIMIVQHGKVVLERWYNGEAADKPHTMWSVSKTFTSAAAGLAISEGLLKLDDRLVDFFPEELPEEQSDNLKAITLRDLLTMTCGHDKEIRIDRKDPTINWERAFLAHPVPYEPGTHFQYNSAGTYMISAIVQKVTGQKVNDYLDARLWQPLCIDKPDWEESHVGVNCGGWGLSLKTEDMAKMGQLLLQGGKWNGGQVLPAEWVAEMTKGQVPSYYSENNVRPDWESGYGYQMWRCQHNAVRADGANGQYIIVIPDKDAVIVLTSDSSLYQPYLDLMWQYVYPSLG